MSFEIAFLNTQHFYTILILVIRNIVKNIYINQQLPFKQLTQFFLLHQKLIVLNIDLKSCTEKNLTLNPGDAPMNKYDHV